MCRIFGYFNAVATPHEMRTVAALQRHGGPDATGVSRAPGWGLGNNRLAVVDLDGGDQPYGRGGPVQVVFNGEIYNHEELRRRLESLGHSVPDRCDGSVLPALYLEYGEEFTEHLDGMYALALLDARGEVPRLLLATDHLGMKPLYLRWDAACRSLRFSSELPALLGFGGVGGRVRESGLDAYLATRTPFGTRTVYEDVEVLQPGTTWVCELGGAPRVRRRPADAPAPAGDDVPAPAGDEGTAAQRVRRALRSEVGRLLVADVPVALITSGGLDSGLVTALAAEHGPVHTFNIAYRGTWPFDERHFAREVAERARAVHHQVEIDPAAFPALLEETVWHLGQPNADPIALSTYALFRAVRDAGFTVALTGDAADEVFGGYERMRRAAERAAAGADWSAAYLDALSAAPAALRTSLYTDAYRAHVREDPALPEAVREDLLHGPGTVLDRITRFELENRLPAYHLRRVDHLSMASSVEARLPFCQRSVVALGRSLRDHQRIRDGRVKRTLYAAAAGLLPDRVLSRPKQPFTLPVTAMLRPGSTLWEYARDLLAPGRIAAAGRLDGQAVDALFASQAERPDDTAAMALWALLVHEVWEGQFRHTAGRPGAAETPAGGARPLAVAA
ncbi:asparagine synthase (glutamine-hydrolyzing) [Streptomyces sp. ICN441]|uniref:asparagine synthase (glutamine-hydrolyzing) n=1 Tax=Streptomyces sp. ICN441 TaxID=2558286 RepID=UPI00106A3279|nr:asparagine synthase (glutamine-hydrolyzing) [Streptomyces sp. ICN441]TFE42838.1 asparagine synthase (glutamine-hydrolyzing) [Streptomyces sp. ICN441]